jgi:beta-ring hydroxylase
MHQPNLLKTNQPTNPTNQPTNQPTKPTNQSTKVDEVLGDELPTVEQLARLKFTTRVINEGMRLYPQPPVLIRRALVVG